MASARANYPQVLNTIFLVIPWVFCTVSHCANYVIDTEGNQGRYFEGVGAISGGGATSKLLTNYPKKQQSEVLDYLFKPNFGASLHILKVEIGGDAQSSEGTEASHMHEPWDENYHRGYEWWLMKEAKKRNPAIKLVGLPWGFPGWLGGGDWWPFKHPNQTADYITRWILGAKKFHDLDIDYVGIWNEKWYDPVYIKALRKMLNARGLGKVQIIAADLLPVDCWDVVNDIDKDEELNAAISVLGCHYGGTASTPEAKKSGKILWSSEDWSTKNDELGGGCMARLLNRNYVNGLITSTIAWNLLYAYYPKLMYAGVGLMTANEPWSGHYTVESPIWGAAHTTQFTASGWRYLNHGSGVGWLKEGGSFVSLVSPDKKHLTIIVETMDSYSHNFCVRRLEEIISVKPQNVTFHFKGAQIPSAMEIWYSKINLDDAPSIYFKHLGQAKVVNNTISLHLEVNAVITLTTLTTGHKGVTKSIPDPGSFPLPYSDNFESYAEFEEAAYLTQQVGVFEVRRSTDASHGQVVRQVMINAPVHWCPEVLTQPMAVMGNYSWRDIHVDVSVFIPSLNGSDGAFLAMKVDQGSCTAFLAKGFFLWILPSAKAFEISLDLTRTQKLMSGPIPVEYNKWHSLGLQVLNQTLTASIDGQTVYNGAVHSLYPEGFVALGTNNFGVADFDDLSIFHP